MRKSVAKIKNYICLTISIFVVAGILVFHLKKILIKLKDNYLSFQKKANKGISKPCIMVIFPFIYKFPSYLLQNKFQEIYPPGCAILVENCCQ